VSVTEIVSLIEEDLVPEVGLRHTEGGPDQEVAPDLLADIVRAHAREVGHQIEDEHLEAAQNPQAAHAADRPSANQTQVQVQARQMRNQVRLLLLAQAFPVVAEVVVGAAEAEVLVAEVVEADFVAEVVHDSTV
jgi:hypothetical protein